MSGWKRDHSPTVTFLQAADPFIQTVIYRGSNLAMLDQPLSVIATRIFPAGATPPFPGLHIWLNTPFSFLTESYTLFRFCRSTKHLQYSVFCSQPANEL